MNINRVKRKKTLLIIFFICFFLAICILYIPQLSIRAALLFEGHVNEALTTKIDSCKLDIPNRMSNYNYYFLSNPPIEDEHFTEMKTWRVAKSIFGTRGEWFTNRDITIDLEDGMITKYQINGELFTGGKECEELYKLLTQDRWYLLLKKDYNLDGLNATDNKKQVIRINDNCFIQLLKIEDDIGYIEFTSNDIKQTYAVSKNYFMQIKDFIEDTYH